MGVCLGVVLGFGHRGVIANGVEGIGNRIAVGTDVVDCILVGLIEALVGYFAVGVE